MAFEPCALKSESVAVLSPLRENVRAQAARSGKADLAEIRLSAGQAGEGDPDETVLEQA